jgi:aerobic-type carbon monoxide dehydrogenase small subunit (CoxS/CutS family)
MKHVSESDPPDQNSQAFQCWAAAKNIIGYVESPKTEKIDMDSEKAVGMKMAMVQCGFATPAQVASLDALANKTIKWTESEGLPELGVGLVQNARKMMGA